MQALRQTKTEVPLRINTVLLNKQIRNTKDFIFTPPLAKRQTLTQKRRNPRVRASLKKWVFKF